MRQSPLRTMGTAGAHSRPRFAAREWTIPPPRWRSQDLIRLRKAIVCLPARYREVVIPCDLHGLSYAAAAGVINTPEGTIGSRLHRGRALLAERLRCRDPQSSRIDSRPCGEESRMNDRMTSCGSKKPTLDN